MKRTVLILLVTLMAVPVAASTDSDTGWVLPDSPLYTVELAWDRIALSLGITDSESVAQKRTAEAETMEEQGDTEHMQVAIEHKNQVLQEEETGSDRSGDMVENDSKIGPPPTPEDR